MQYKYRKINLEQFAVLTDGPIEADTEINIRTDIEFAYERENRLLTSKMTLTADNNSQTLMKAVMSSFFEIAPESINEITDTPLKDLVIPPVYFHKIITSAFIIE